MADEMGEIFAEQLGGEVVSDGVQEQHNKNQMNLQRSKLQRRHMKIMIVL